MTEPRNPTTAPLATGERLFTKWGFDYFRDRCWISCDPDERTIPALIERFGDRFMWASDFPHADHTPEYIGYLDELAAAVPAEHRAPFLGENARTLFGIEV